MSRMSDNQVLDHVPSLPTTAPSTTCISPTQSTALRNKASPARTLASVMWSGKGRCDNGQHPQSHPRMGSWGLLLSQIENPLLRGAHIKNSYRLFPKTHDEIFGALPKQFGNQDLGAIIQFLQPMCPEFERYWWQLRLVEYPVIYIGFIRFCVTCPRFHSTTSGVW